MKKLLYIGLLLSVAATAVAQENRKVLKVYDWRDLPEHFPNSQITSMDGISVLKVENADGLRPEFSPVTITNVSLLKNANAIAWEMKYENVVSTNSWIGTYELVEQYPPRARGGDYVTNSDEFPLSGTRNWDRYGSVIRPAPYDNETKPIKLEIKLVLPSQGTVYLRPIKLIKWVNPNSDNWWTPQQSGLIGGIGGSLIGCLGGLIGLLVSKGKARNFVLASVKCFIVFGILLMIAGLTAAALKQPYAVWYALLLPGVILILVFSLNLNSIQRRYDELEIRRMTSMDTTGS